MAWHGTEEEQQKEAVAEDDNSGIQMDKTSWLLLNVITSLYDLPPSTTLGGLNDWPVWEVCRLPIVSLNGEEEEEEDCLVFTLY